jgi:hypothetical protein
MSNRLRTAMWLLVVLATVVFGWMWTSSVAPPAAIAAETASTPPASAAGPPSAASVMARLRAPPTERPRLMVAPALRGHRATAQQRQSYADALASAPDLAAWGRSITDLALAGDADAAAGLAQMYSKCGFALDSVIPPTAAQANRVPSLPAPIQDLARRCAGLGAPGQLTSLNLSSSASAWLHTAAHLGHPLSILGDPDPDPPYRREIGAVERAKRAAAEQLLGAGAYADLAPYAAALGSLTDYRMSGAWTHTLCALAQCPGPAAVCASNAVCSERILQNDLRRMTARQRRELAGRQLAILHAIDSGDFSAVWRPDPMAPAP